MRNFITIVENELPMDTASRMQRARDLGFTIRAYHGTGMTFKAFDLNKGRAATIAGFAPHFADSKAEATGYTKDRPGRGRTLEVLLRVKRPFTIDLNGPPQYISKAEYTALVGVPFEDKWSTEPRTSKTLTDMEYTLAGNASMEFSREDASNRRRWAMIYHRLTEAGYDALLWPQTPPDHSHRPYGKYVVFDPKNIRLAKATFDPAQSESSDLMA